MKSSEKYLKKSTKFYFDRICLVFIRKTDKISIYLIITRGLHCLVVVFVMNAFGSKLSRNVLGVKVSPLNI
jgi:hypothetical protein